MLVVVLPDMVVARDVLVLLMMLVVVLMVLVVLEGLAQVHHGIVLPSPSIHHDVVALVPMALVEHGKLRRRRLAPRGSCGGRCVGVAER